MAAPPCETTINKAAREVTGAVVRSAWAAAQEWTVAWKVGSSHLKTVVDGLEGLGGDGVPDKGVHDAAKSVHDALVKMVSSGSVISPTMSSGFFGHSIPWVLSSLLSLSTNSPFHMLAIGETGVGIV